MLQEKIKFLGADGNPITNTSYTSTTSSNNNNNNDKKDGINLINFFWRSVSDQYLIYLFIKQKIFLVKMIQMKMMVRVILKI